MNFFKSFFVLIGNSVKAVLDWLIVGIKLSFFFAIPILEIFFGVMSSFMEKDFFYLLVDAPFSFGATALLINKIYFFSMISIWLLIAFSILIYFATRLSDFEINAKLNKKERLILELLNGEDLFLSRTQLVKKSKGVLSTRFFTLNLHLACLTRFGFIETGYGSTNSFFAGMSHEIFRITKEGSSFLNA